MSMWDIQYVELRSPEKIESDRLERLRLNQVFKNSGRRYYDPNHKIHYSRFNSVDHLSDGTFSNGSINSSDVMYYNQNPDNAIHTDYYIRAAKQLGITVEQAAKASRRGAEAGSGKARDSMVRGFQDQNDGGNRANQYAVNRKLAAKVTASSYARMGASERSYYDQMPNVFNFAKQASDEAGRIEDIAIELRRVQEETSRIAEENRVRIEMDRELKVIEDQRLEEKKRVEKEKKFIEEKMAIEEKKFLEEKRIIEQKIMEQQTITAEIEYAKNNPPVTFTEQKNDGDFNISPTSSALIPDTVTGSHKMPDGTTMKDSDMDNQNGMIIGAGMAATIGIGIVGLLLYTRRDKK